MKKVLSGLLLLWLPMHAELNVKKIETMVQKIQNKRVSLHNVDFLSVPSPFVIFVSKEENRSEKRVIQPKESVQFSLGAIINNRAFINGRWVQIGDMVLGYKVEQIDAEKVIMKKDDREIRLYLPKQDRHDLLQLSEG